MLPCFCRSLEVITAGARGCWRWDGGHRACLGTAHSGDPPSLHPPGDPEGAACPPPIMPPHFHTFAKRDAVQVAALEEAGLDRAGLWEEQLVLPPCPKYLWAPCPHSHPTLVSPGPSPGGLCSSGCTAAPVHPSKASGAALSPFLWKKQGEGCQSLRKHPGVMWGHMPQTGIATLSAPEPWEPPKSVCSSF